MANHSSTDNAPANGDHRRPDHEVRVGLAKAAIWINSTEKGFDTHSIAFSRLYKTEQGEWRSTTKNWGRNDLFSLSECVRLVHVWIANRGMRNQSCPVSTESTDSASQT